MRGAEGGIPRHLSTTCAMARSHISKLAAGGLNVLVGRRPSSISVPQTRPSVFLPAWSNQWVSPPPHAARCHFHNPPTARFPLSNGASDTNNKDSNDYEWEGIQGFVHRHIDYVNPSCQACSVPLIPDPDLIPHWRKGEETPPTADGVERKPMCRHIGYVPLCEPCAEKARQRRTAARALRDEKIADRRRRLDALLDHIKAMPRGDHVPIRYAVDKLMDAVATSGHPYPGSPRPERWYRTYIRHAWHLEKPLCIEKVGARWKCDKQRVDAMDFTLYFYRYDRHIDL